MKKNLLLILITLCLCTLVGCKCEHTWVAATCTQPKTCSECGEIEGEVAEHIWSAATCTAPESCSTCGSIRGEPLDHNWEKATCTTPKTCKTCGETEGEPLTHTWKDATCTAPKTCTACGKAEGETLEHSWQDATCITPKTCSICKKTTGTALGHTPGEWITEDPDYSSVYYSATQYCSVCNAYLDTDIIFFTTMHEDGLFLFSPEEFAERLESYYSVLKSGMTTQTVVLDDNTLGCGIIYKGECIAVISFNDDDGTVDGDDKDAHTLSSMMVKYFTDDVSEVVESMYGILFACHPTLEKDVASALARAIVYAAEDNEYYEYQGIKHLLGVRKNAYWFIVSVLK